MRFFALFVFCSGAVPRGAPKSHMACWGEEKCTLEASNRRKKLFKRRLRTYRRAFRRRLHLAKYKIQLAFLAVSQRVGLYILLPLCLFRHAGAAYGRPLLFFCALLQPNEPLHFTKKSYRASRPLLFFQCVAAVKRAAALYREILPGEPPFLFFSVRCCSQTSRCALQRNLTGRAALFVFLVRCCSQTSRYTLQRILTGRAAAVYSVFLRYKIASMVVRWGCRPQLS